MRRPVRVDESGEGALLGERSSVLIVERSVEIREVLRTALERRGLEIYEASRTDLGLQLARRHQPNLVVLDLDEQSADAEALTGEFSKSASAEPTPVIILGALRRPLTFSGEF